MRKERTTKELYEKLMQLPNLHSAPELKNELATRSSDLVIEGIFIRKPIFWNLAFLICGALFIALYIFLNIVDSEATSELLTFLIFGIILCLVGLFSLLWNHGAYIRIDSNSIHTKYHWFGKLDCRIDEVAFALAQINTLTILLKNGKRHVIMGVENPWPLSSAIRRQIFKIESEAPTDVRLGLEAAQAARKKELFWVLGGISFMFINIFIAAFLTGGREMPDFSKLDWLLFAIMGAIEALTVIATFYFAGRCGKHLLPIEQLKYRLKGAYIASQPLPTGNVKHVYTDENNTGRMVVYGFPNDESVYCCVQEFMHGPQLETVHISEIYESEDVLAEEADLCTFIDITKHFQ